jgi:transglutaminase-like putative cysteine protease
MLLRIGYEFQFDLTGTTPMVLMLHTHPDQAHVLRLPEVVKTEPELPVHTFTDGFGNRAARLIAPAGKLRITYDNVAWDSGLHEPTIQGQRLHLVEELPDDVLPYLMGSRYCEVDRLGPMAWDLFGKLPATWERVQAIMDFVHSHISFGYKFARMNKTAYDAWYERKGVCRDFQHLAITLMRAMNIPARYATGYLGDIGVPPDGLPMDFSAWMEVYLGNKWWTLDARHNTPRIGRVLMARGRDATDVALTTSFGPARLEKFLVHMDEVADDLVTPIDSFKVLAPTPPLPVAA